jgi:hypothetical protein
VVRVSKYGKILRIFDEFSILVNLGAADGIKRGDRFAVIEEGEEIIDPDTKESLGKLEIIKVEMIASDVQERISLLSMESEAVPTQDIPLSAKMVKDSMKTGKETGGMLVGGGEIAGMPVPAAVHSGDKVRLIE